MPDARQGGTGDLLVQVFIEVPKKLSTEHQRVLRELAQVEEIHVSPERKSFFDKIKEYFQSG
jgi:molecular chaperone DnaJ